MIKKHPAIGIEVGKMGDEVRGEGDQLMTIKGRGSGV